MTTKDNMTGVFLGRTLVQQHGEIGGARSVFVKLQGNKNELVFPTFGGQVKNPFKGQAKLFAGDLCEYRTDENGVKPQIFILKTFEVKSADTNAKTVTIKRDGYRHIPFVGDIIGLAPEKIGGAMTGVTVLGVKQTKDTWVLTLSDAITATEGKVLVEAKKAGSSTMLVENINAVCACDYDFLYSPVAAVDLDEEHADFENARYFFTPCLGGLMYTKKMSVMPDCVKALNTSKVNGWFKVGTWGNF